jgi:hypothetical protein
MTLGPLEHHEMWLRIPCSIVRERVVASLQEKNTTTTTVHRAGPICDADVELPKASTARLEVRNEISAIRIFSLTSKQLGTVKPGCCKPSQKFRCSIFYDDQLDHLLSIFRSLTAPMACPNTRRDVKPLLRYATVIEGKACGRVYRIWEHRVAYPFEQSAKTRRFAYRAFWWPLRLAGRDVWLSQIPRISSEYTSNRCYQHRESMLSKPAIRQRPHLFPGVLHDTIQGTCLVFMDLCRP